MTNMYPCTALHCPPGQEGGREPVCGVEQGGGQDEHQHNQSAVHHVHWGVQWCYGAMVQWCNGAMVLWCYGAVWYSTFSAVQLPGGDSAELGDENVPGGAGD